MGSSLWKLGIKSKEKVQKKFDAEARYQFSNNRTTNGGSSNMKSKAQVNDRGDRACGTEEECRN